MHSGAKRRPGPGSVSAWFFSLKTPWRSLLVAVRASLQEPQRVFASRYPEGGPRVRRTDGGRMEGG